jgi:hypothetical protein
MHCVPVFKKPADEKSNGIYVSSLLEIRVFRDFSQTHIENSRFSRKPIGLNVFHREFV